MTEPVPSGGPSRLRVGGLVLFGVGVVAGIIGLAMLALDGGSGDGPTAAPGPSASVTDTPGLSASATPTVGATPTESAAPTGEGPVPLPSFDATPTGDSAAPPAPAPPSGGDGSRSEADGRVGTGGGGGGAAVVRPPVRVYNNSNIEGLAARAAADFQAAGWTVTETKGYPYGIIPASTVYYRPGTAEQTAAQELADAFGLRVEPRFEGIKNATPGLIVILTRDYESKCVSKTCK
ncbi:MAG: LytR C-terminal domain-containing protein [Pseudonocardia sp.]